MADDYGYDLFKTVALAGAGVLLLYGINKFFKLRSSPIVLGLGNSDESKADHKITIDIPEIWVPYQAGDSKDSVILKYKPTIGISGTNWVLSFKPITANIGSLTTTYTPDPVKIPITQTLNAAEVLTRFTPIVTATTSPIGWNVKFAPVTLLY